MSHLLETLGRGLPGQLLDVFSHQLPGDSADDFPALSARAAGAPPCDDLALRAGLAALRAGRLGQALRWAERAVELAPQRPAVHVSLACVHDARARLFDAQDALVSARRLDPGDPAVAFGLGMCRERAGLTEQAERDYADALRSCDRLRNGYERLAAIAVARHDWPAAIGHYEQLAELEPDDVDVLLTLAALRFQRGEIDAAIEGFQRALLIEPESADDALLDQELLDQAGLDSAISTMEQAVAQYPGVTELHVHLADLYAKAGRDPDATRAYRTALELRPNFLEATVKLGTQHLRRRRYDAAARAFNRATELNDRLLLAFAGLCAAQHAAGLPGEALASLDLAVGLAPNSNLLLSEATRLHFQALGRRAAGDDGETVATQCADPHLARALRVVLAEAERRAVDAGLHYRAALLLRQCGDAPAALDALRRAVTCDPCYAKALVQLAAGLREGGDEVTALECCRAAFTLTEGAIERHYALALLFAQRSRFDLLFDEVAADQPDSPARQGQLLLALQHAGAVDPVRTSWDTLHALSHAGGAIELEDRNRALADLLGEA